MSSKTAFKWVPLVTGIYFQGSVIRNTIKTEWWLQPVVSSRTGAQTKTMKIDSKTTRNIESPDLPGVMLLTIIVTLLCYGLLIWLVRAVLFIYSAIYAATTWHSSQICISWLHPSQSCSNLSDSSFILCNYGPSATHFAYI